MALPFFWWQGTETPGDQWDGRVWGKDRRGGRGSRRQWQRQPVTPACEEAVTSAFIWLSWRQRPAPGSQGGRGRGQMRDKMEVSLESPWCWGRPSPAPGWRVLPGCEASGGSAPRTWS